MQEKVIADIEHSSPCFTQPPDFDDAVAEEDKPLYFLSVKISGNTKASFSLIVNLFFLDLNDKQETDICVAIQ